MFFRRTILNLVLAVLISFVFISLAFSNSRIGPSSDIEIDEISHDWQLFYTGEDTVITGVGAVIDSLGNIYYLGTREPESYAYEFTLLSINPFGEILWEYTTSDMNVDDGYLTEPTAIAIDNFDNIVIGGRGNDSEENYAITYAKLSTNGELLWVSQPDSALGKPRMINIDQDNNIIACSKYSSPSNWSTIKLSDEGEELWFQNLLNPTAYDGSPTDCDIDAEGYVYVTGYYCPLYREPGAVTVKYSPDGNVEWIRQYSDLIGWSFSRACVLDDSTNLYTTGQETGERYVLKYNSDGDIIWEYQFETSSPDYNASMKIDDNGDLIIVANGYFVEDEQRRDVIEFYRMSLDGDSLDYSYFESENPKADNFDNFYFDPDGYIALFGSTQFSDYSGSLLTAFVDSCFAVTDTFYYAYPDSGRSWYERSLGGLISSNSEYYSCGYLNNAIPRSQVTIIKYIGDNYINSTPTYSSSIPDRFQIRSAYPNPFNAGINISIDLPVAATMQVAIYDILGRKVREWAETEYSAGQTKLYLQSNDLASGVFFVRASIPGYNAQIRKIVHMK